MNWWENIPQRKVGDLVRGRNGKLYLVIKTRPVKPCRVNPVQHSLLVGSDGEEYWIASKGLEVINESR